MTNPIFLFSPSGVSDIRGIVRYTLKNFGQAQLNSYLDALEK